MKTMRFVIVAVAFAGLTACKTKSASEYATSEIWANISASAEGDGSAKISVTYTDQETSLTFLQLVADDTLVATTGTTTQELAETTALGVVSYSTKFTTEAADTEFVVSLTRQKDSGAPDSRLSLAVPFTITPITTTANGSSRVQDTVHIVWTNSPGTAVSADPQTLEATGECIEKYTGPGLTADMTTYNIPPNGLTKSTDDNAPDQCDVTVTIKRTRQGTLDPGYKGGDIRATQTRTTTFKSIP